MKEQVLVLPFPVKGLVVNQPFGAQPPGTTTKALNVRGYEPVGGRDRGGQRPGMTKYMASQAVTPGQNPGQEINQLTASGLPSYSTATNYLAYRNGKINFLLANLTGGSTAVGSTAGLAMCWDSSNNLYSTSNTGNNTNITFTGTTGAGATLWSTSIAPLFTTAVACCMTFGGGFVWAAVSYGSHANTYLYQINAGTGAIIGSTYVYTQAKSPAAAMVNAIAYCTGVVAIGYLGGFVDLYNVLQSTAVTIQVQNSNTPDVLDIDTDGLTYFYVASNNSSAVQAYLVKIDLDGNILWTNNTTNTNLSSVCYDNVNNIVAACFTATTGGFVHTVVTYNPSTGAQINPCYPNSQGWQCVRRNGSGALVLSNCVHTGGNAVSTAMVVIVLNGVDFIQVVTAATVISTAAFTAPTIRPIAPSAGNIAATLPSLSRRNLRNIVVAGGTIVRATPSGPVAIPGGSAALSPVAPVIFSAQVNQQLYFVDGMVGYKYYDGPTDAVLSLVATSGSLPIDSSGSPARLCAAYRTRLALAGFPNDPFNIYFAAVGDPTNWNYNPTPSVETQAVVLNNAGVLATTGVPPDVITCLLPYNDETMFIGCANSILILTGDPMSGGRLDLVSDEVGMAWGQPWCRDGSGVIYFVSSNGSVYTVVPGALPTRISDPVSELLMSINTGNAIVRLAWDERQHGFWLFYTQAVGYAVNPLSYFFDTRNNAWWQDDLANTNYLPGAVRTLDDDSAATRAVYVVGFDGYVRYMDQAATSDDGTTINSYAYLGPIADQPGSNTTVADIQATLDTASGPVTFNVFSAQNPQTALAGPARFTGSLVAGRNRSQPVRSSGNAHYVQILANGSAQSWQFEELRVRLRVPEGKARQRIF